MIKKIFFLFYLPIFVLNCHSPKTQFFDGRDFYDQDFNLKQLKSIKIPNVCDSIKYAGSLIYNSGKVIVSEFGENRCFHVIDIDNKSYIGAFGDKGRGPGEMSMPWTMLSTNTEDAKFQIFDLQQVKIVVFSLDSLDVKKPYINQYQFENSLQASDMVFLDNRFYYLSHINSENRIYVSDIDGNKINGFGKFPVPNEGFPENTFVEGYQVKWDINNNYFVLGYKTTPIIQIFNKNIDKWELIRGPEQFPSIFEEHPHQQMAMGFTDETRIGYMDIKVTANYIYALYSGQLLFDKSGTENCNIIYKFDLNGSPVQKLILDKSIMSFDVAEDRFIYGITTDEMGHYELLEFNLY